MIEIDVKQEVKELNVGFYVDNPTDSESVSLNVRRLGPDLVEFNLEYEGKVLTHLVDTRDLGGGTKTAG